MKKQLRLLLFSLGMMIFCVQNVFAQAPPNDLCQNAQELCIDGNYVGTVINSTDDMPLDIACIGDADTQGSGVWYRFTGNGNTVTFQFPAGGGWDPEVNVFTGSCGAWVCETGDDDGGPGFSALVNVNTIFGVVYYVYVHHCCGGSANFNFTVSGISDVVVPTALCQDATVQLDVTGTGFLFFNQVDNGSFDNCALANFPFALSQSTFGCTDIGNQVVNLTVTDASGNSSVCQASVSVEDNVPPTVVCAGVNLQLDNNGNAVLDPVDGVFAVNETCGPLSYVASQTNFNCMNIGNNVVNIMVSDGSNNIGLCNANIMVADNISPTALCSNVTLVLNEITNSGSANLNVNQVDAGSFDNCFIGNRSLSRNTPWTCADIANNPTTVTLTITDTQNNSSSCDAQITVLDQTPPTAICQPATVQLDANGIVTIGLNNVLAIATDNCGVVPGGQLTQDAFNCGDLGANNVTVSVVDVNGLTGSCIAVVTVEDLIPPTALCQDLTVDLDINGTVTINANQIDNGSSDNCNMITLAASPNTFFCGNVGSNPVTLSVTDQSNNVSTCTGIVTVRDLIAPIALCQNATIFLDDNGAATLSPSQIDNGSNDACGIAQRILSKTEFDCSHIGNNPVVLTVIDPNGNSSTCAASVTVVDLIPAVILCRPPVNTVNDLGVCGADVILLPPLVLEENCSIEQVLNNAPAIFPIGTTTVTWALLDAGNNPSTCMQNVTIYDTEAPVIDCGNTFTAFTSWDNCGYPSGLLGPVFATDNCGFVSVTDDAPAFFPPGQYMVNYTAIDASGNSATCMKWVKIYDTTKPKLISCPGDQLEEATTADGAPVTWPAPTAMDNCPGDIIWVNSHDSGDFFPLGETEVTLTGYDHNGNFVECSFIVNVIPQQLPLTLNCLETIEISTQEEINLDEIVWNSPLVQSLCEECDILKDDAFDYMGGFEGHNYYLFNSEKMNWEEAQQVAEDLGGYLAVINSEKENQFLATEIEEGNAWIGLADINGNGIVAWADGSTYENPTWQEDITLIGNFSTAFILNELGEWQIEPSSETNYFLFEIPCYDLQMITDNDDNIGAPGTETLVTYYAADMCGNIVTCDFQLIFTDETVDYCNEGSVVTDEAEQYFINHLVMGDYFNESGNDDGYGDFTNHYIVLAPGEIIDLYANFGPFDADHPLYCRLWVDLNADGDFYDAGELLGEAIDVLEMTGELELPIMDEAITETRLRIAISRFGYPEPCGSFANGEVEDYTITLDHEKNACFTQVDLQGIRDGFTAKLTWITQTNCDIDSYDIERSSDGVSFEKIETALQDNTEKNIPSIYDEIDHSPNLGKNYYRLQVFPENGLPFYTNTVHIKFNDEQERLSIYPNPADEYLMMNIEDADGLPAQLKIYSSLGVQVYRQSFDEITEAEIQIPLDRLVADGTYYLHLTIEGQRPLVKKFVVDKLNGFIPSAK